MPGTYRIIRSERQVANRFLNSKQEGDCPPVLVLWIDGPPDNSNNFARTSGTKRHYALRLFGFDGIQRKIPDVTQVKVQIKMF